MIGHLIIDGVDIYNSFGVFAIEGGCKDIASFPDMKQPEIYDWAERDGIEADLSAPKFSALKLVIEFAATKDGSPIQFLRFLSQTGYRTCNFAFAGITKQLRVVSCPEFDNDLIRFFSVEFSQDSFSFVNSSPTFTAFDSGYKLNGIDFSAYGVQMLEGTDSSILKEPALKQNLTIDIPSTNGISYDTGRVKYASKDVRFRCLIRAANVAEFWANMNALFYQLSTSGYKTIEHGGLNYECFYKSMSVSDFTVFGRVWCEFDLNLVFTKLGVEI